MENEQDPICVTEDHPCIKSMAGDHKPETGLGDVITDGAMSLTFSSLPIKSVVFSPELHLGKSRVTLLKLNIPEKSPRSASKTLILI